MSGETPRVVGKRVLVTGGGGFMGSNLVELLAPDNEVRVLDDLTTGKRENLERGGSASGPRSSVDLRVGDVRDAAHVKAAMEGVDLVFHLAVRNLRVGLHDPVPTAEVNAMGSLVVALAAAELGLERMVYVSSSEIYGDAWGDGDAPAPTTVYGSSKLAGEELAVAVGRQTGLRVVVARPFNAYGPRCHLSGPSAEVLARFALRLRAGRPLPVFGDGEQTRAYTWVGDVARGIAACGAVAEPTPSPIDIARPEAVSVRTLGRMLAERLPEHPLRWKELPPRPGDVAAQRPRTGVARRLLGFEASVPFGEGLDRFVDWLSRAAPDPEAVLAADPREQNW